MEKYFYKRWRNIADQGNMQAVLVQAATIAITGLQIVDQIPATFGLQGAIHTTLIRPLMDQHFLEHYISW